MNRTLLLAAIIMSVGILAGCSKNEQPAATETSEKTEAAKAVETDDEDAAEWPRTFTDAGDNEITLEEKPERIAILHSNYLEYFFALGTPPAASAGASVGTAQQAVDTYETLEAYRDSAKVMDLGSAREINLEAVMEAQPDVIVTFLGHSGLDEIYDQLTAIAPVVLIDFSATWQDQTRACAQVVGEEELAEEIIAETESAIAEACEQLSQTDSTVALFRTNGGTAFVGRGNEAYYQDFGLTAPDGYTFDYATFSLEAVADMNPDYIIFQDYIDVSEAFVQTQEESSVWTNMTAAANDKVVYFDDSLNTFGPLAMRLTAEKLTQAIPE